MAASSPLPGSPRLVPALLATLCVPLAAALAAKADKFDKGEKGEKGEKAEFREARRDGFAEPPPRKASRENAAEIEQRNQDKLRERLAVTDDAEWAIILERIRRVEELRRTSWSTAAAPRPVPGEKAKRTTTVPEQAALRSALADKLTDAEIRLRLARAHEVHEQHQAKLAQAQASLRAVLTVRQEAVAVTYGLLPP